MPRAWRDGGPDVREDLRVAGHGRAYERYPVRETRWAR